jgi:hypothetical protein
MTNENSSRNPSSTSRTFFSASFQLPHIEEYSHEDGSVKPLNRSLRHGCRPALILPLKRAIGWRRCRRAVRSQRRRISKFCPGATWNEARAAFRLACASERKRARIKRGAAIRSGRQKIPMAESTPRQLVTRYHSGMVSKESSAPVVRP